MFLRSFIISLIVPALILLPLFLHKSQFPALGPYSTKYAFLLGTAIFLGFLSASIIAWICAVKKSSQLAVNLLLSWATVIVLVVCIEMALRHTRLNDVFLSYSKNGQQKAILYGYTNDVNHTWNDSGAIHHTDKKGYRVHNRIPDWSHHKELVKIFALGGSSTFGYRIGDEEAWPALLDKGLSQTDKKYTVINAGNNGHNSVQMLLKSYFQVASEHPSFLLIYQNRNDAQERSLDPAEVFIDKEIVFSTTLVDYLKAIHYGNFYFETILGHLLKTAVGKFFIKRERMHRVESGIAEMPDEKIQMLNKHNGARYKRNLKALVTLARMEEIQPIFLTFLHNPEGMAPHKSALITHLNQEMRMLAEELSIPLIDLEEKFKDITNKAPYFQDDAYHPSVKGAQFIATNVREDLLEILSGKMF